MPLPAKAFSQVLLGRHTSLEFALKSVTQTLQRRQLGFEIQSAILEQCVYAHQRHLPPVIDSFVALCCLQDFKDRVTIRREDLLGKECCL